MVNNENRIRETYGFRYTFSTTSKKEKRGWETTTIRNVAIVLLSTFRLTHTQISSTNQRAYMKFARRKKRNTYISHVLDDEWTKGRQSDAVFSDERLLCLAHFTSRAIKTCSYKKVIYSYFVHKMISRMILLGNRTLVRFEVRIIPKYREKRCSRVWCFREVKFREDESGPNSRRQSMINSSFRHISSRSLERRSLRRDFSKAMQIRGHFARHITSFFA